MMTEPRSIGTMQGAGVYGRHATPQAASARAGAMPLLADALAAHGPFVDGSRPVVLADYGCAGGVNSLEPLAAMVAAIRRTSAARPIVIAHIDQPANDFAALFAALEQRPEPDPLVFPLAVGRSFYGPVLPPASVCLGWCSHSAHWLSRVPGGLDGHVFAQLASPAAREPWTRQAALDWATFVRHRARELEHDGQLIVEVAAVNAQGQVGSEPMYRTLDRALELMVEHGRLRPSEAERIVIPVYNRTETELRAPFAAAELGREVQVAHMQLRGAPDPFLDELTSSGDVGPYARSWAATVRAFSEDPFFGATALGHRPPSERRELADAFYALFEELIAADPSAFTNHWNVADLRIVRS